MKCFNNFFESAVNARREGDENRNSSAVAETMKLLANSSDDYQIMDLSGPTVATYLSDKKTHGAIKNKFVEILCLINDQLYQVELVKSKNEHKEPLIVEFFNLQNEN